MVFLSRFKRSVVLDAYLSLSENAEVPKLLSIKVVKKFHIVRMYFPENSFNIVFI